MKENKTYNLNNLTKQKRPRSFRNRHSRGKKKKGQLSRQSVSQSRREESESENEKVKGLPLRKSLGQERKEEGEIGVKKGQLSRQSFGQQHVARNRTTPTGQKRTALNQKGTWS